MAISLVDLKDRQFAEEEWIIPGLLTRKNTAFLMGQPKKASKSWMLLDAAWSLAEGEVVWGISTFKPPRPMKCIYFTQEDSEANIQDRVLHHVGAGRSPAVPLWVVPKNLNLKLDTPHGVAAIKRELDVVVERAGGIDLVIFDPMRRIHDGEENDSSTIAKLWAVLDGLHNTLGCATIISHHITKPPGDREGYDPTDPYHGRGSGDIYGGGDAFVMVVPGALAPDGKSYRKLSVHFETKRGEQLPPAELKMNFLNGRVQYLGQGAQRL